MNVSINAKRLRASLPGVVKRVQKGARFTVIYRSRPAFQIVPVNDAEHWTGNCWTTRCTAPVRSAGRAMDGLRGITIPCCTAGEGTVRAS